MNHEYFAVKLASEISLGIPLADMGTVIQLKTANICTVPGIARFWYGVANFKGSLLWVLDSDRYFDPNTPLKNPPKLTAVIIRSQQLGSSKKVALVTQQLKGIISVEPSCLQPITDDTSLQLRECCSAVAQTETNNTYIINSVAMLQKLDWQSSLVSA